MNAPAPAVSTDELRTTILAALKEQGIGDTVRDVIEEQYNSREERIEERMAREFDARMAQKGFDEMTLGRNPIGAVCAALMQTKGDTDAALESVEKYLGPDVWRTMNLGQATEGGVLIPGDVIDRWYDALAPTTAVLSFGPQIVPMPRGTVDVPGFTGRPSFQWTHEVNTEEIHSQPPTGSRRLSAKKGMVLCSISNSMLQTDLGPRLARFVERQARREISIGVDQAFLRGSGTEFTPKGMRLLAGSTLPMTGGGPTLTTALTDFAAMFQALEGANVMATNLGHIMPPRSKNWLMFNALTSQTLPYFLEEMRGGTLLGVPFRATNNIPTNLGGGGNESEHYFADFDHLLVGEVGAIRVEYFREGSFKQAGGVTHLIDSDSQAVRLVIETDLETEYPESIHIMTGVTYGV